MLLTQKPSPGFFFLAGLLPILLVHLAYALNLAAGLQGCNPYWDGCLSVSRAVRSGPGLWWFKLGAAPVAACMLLAWWSLPRPPFNRFISWLGSTGTLAFLVYALALGTEGDVYRWMRRYGVVFYFAMTGLAQLILARSLQLSWRAAQPVAQAARTRLQPPSGSPVHAVVHSRAALRGYFFVLSFTWAVGVLSAFKRRISDDPAFIDRLQNVLEWFFALGLALGFVALALVLRPGSRRAA